MILPSRVSEAIERRVPIGPSPKGANHQVAMVNDKGMASDSLGTDRGHRPKSLESFVGQDHLKQLIRTAVASAKHRNAPFPHSLLTGPAGTGKTTLSSIIATEMGVDVISTTADSLEDADDVRSLLSGLDSNGYDREGQPIGPIRPTVLFLDEAHRLSRRSQELLYACLEDRVVDATVRDPLTGRSRPVRQWVPFFTLVAATNRPGDLTTAFRDRLRLDLRLEAYGERDSARIARQALEGMGIRCSPQSARLIASRGRGVPRRIIGLCEHVRDAVLARGKASVTLAVCTATFGALGMDPLGLGRQEVELLRHLAQASGKAVGLRTLASLLGEDVRALEEATEPYLMQVGLIARTPQGRMITEKGVQHLSEHHDFDETEESGS